MIANTKCDMASSLTKARCALLRLKGLPSRTPKDQGLLSWTSVFNVQAPTPTYEGAKPLQCATGFCWCVYADGTKIPNTKCETAFSSLTDAKCALLRNKVPTPVDTSVIVGVTKRQCACKMSLKLSTFGSSSAYACDPYLQHNFLVCQDDGTYESKPCPVVGQSWNYVEKTCSDKMRKCRPLPATCL